MQREAELKVNKIKRTLKVKCVISATAAQPFWDGKNNDIPNPAEAAHYYDSSVCCVILETIEKNNHACSLWDSLCLEAVIKKFSTGQLISLLFLNSYNFTSLL